MYAIVDIETTGFSHEKHKIIEVAIIVYNGQIVNKYETLINPGCDIPEKITALTGITNDMLTNAPSFEVVANEILKTIGKCIVVGHNVRFDYMFLKTELKNIGIKFENIMLDTLAMSRDKLPKTNHSLENLAKIMKIDTNGAHRAMKDAMITLELFKKIKS